MSIGESGRIRREGVHTTQSKNRINQLKEDHSRIMQQATGKAKEHPTNKPPISTPTPRNTPR